MNVFQGFFFLTFMCYFNLEFSFFVSSFKEQSCTNGIVFVFSSQSSFILFSWIFRSNLTEWQMLSVFVHVVLFHPKPWLSFRIPKCDQKGTLAVKNEFFVQPQSWSSAWNWTGVLSRAGPHDPPTLCCPGDLKSVDVLFLFSHCGRGGGSGGESGGLTLVTEAVLGWWIYCKM